MLPFPTTTTTTLALGYATTTTFLLTGLLLRHARWPTTLASPLLAIPTFLAATITAALIITTTKSLHLSVPHVALLIPTTTCALTGLLVGLYRARAKTPTVSRGTRILSARDAARPRRTDARRLARPAAGRERATQMSPRSTSELAQLTYRSRPVCCAARRIGRHELLIVGARSRVDGVEPGDRLEVDGSFHDYGAFYVGADAAK